MEKSTKSYAYVFKFIIQKHLSNSTEFASLMQCCVEKFYLHEKVQHEFYLDEIFSFYLYFFAMKTSWKITDVNKLESF
jgi:hypothetical protein